MTTSSGRVTKIFYMDRRGRRREALRKEDMERACIQEGKERFTQCQTTPFFQSPLLEVVGIIPDAETTTQILQGTIVLPSDTDVHAAKLLRAMKLPPNFTETSFIDPKISTDQHMKQWRKQKETTASEPKGPSYAQYIAGTYNKEVRTIDTIMRSLPREIGFSPEAWQVITDFQILKKPGVYDIDKMRIIQLMHAEFNANNKHDGKTMMSNAEEHKTLVKDQFGSRKNRQANRTALGKLLFFNILRQKVLAGAVVSNDAKACYDRIALSVAFLAMARQGVAYTALFSLFETLRLATHFILTGYGVSSTKYGGKDFNAEHLPLSGIGQGNGAGPAIWAVISTLLVTLMMEDGLGATLLSALSLSTLIFVGFLFVDDTDLMITTKDPSKSDQGLLPQVQPTHG